MDVPHARLAGPMSGREGSLALSVRPVSELRSADAAWAVVLVGVPFDGGIVLNGGRPGAAGGPAAFRKAFSRAGTRFDAARGETIGVPVYDAGDIEPVGNDPDERTLEATHERVREAFAALHAAGAVTLGVGGGHDLTAAMAEGAARGRGVSGVGGVNVDPHLDVREQVGSGMPFRRLIERGVLDARRFTVIGAGRFSNSVPHTEWLATRGARVVTLEHARGVVPAEPGTDHWSARCEEALRRARVMGDGAEPGFVSFDLDALDASVGPGVSATNPHGLTSAEAMAAAELAGGSPGVMHFDIVELSPPFDEGGRTALVAAQIAARFIAGVAAR